MSPLGHMSQYDLGTEFVQEMTPLQPKPGIYFNVLLSDEMLTEQDN